jgi:hypothetical protein
MLSSDTPRLSCELPWFVPHRRSVGEPLDVLADILKPPLHSLQRKFVNSADATVVWSKINGSKVVEKEGKMRLTVCFEK